MVNSLSRLGLPCNTTSENRRLAIELDGTAAAAVRLTTTAAVVAAVRPTTAAAAAWARAFAAKRLKYFVHGGVEDLKGFEGQWELRSSFNTSKKWWKQIRIFCANVTHPQHGEDSRLLIAAVVASMDRPKVTKDKACYLHSLHNRAVALFDVCARAIASVTVQNTSESSTMSLAESFFWVPFISENVLSVIDVDPLSLVQSYLDDVSIGGTTFDGT
ncbi:hypothetical protein Tco_0524737 [Tanacetum coccineum]